MANAVDFAAAEAQFHISAVDDVPPGFNAWQIRNDYPLPGDILPGVEPTPWLDVDFHTDPTQYINLIREYFMAGMVQADFNPHNNPVRRFFLFLSRPRNTLELMCDSTGTLIDQRLVSCALDAYG